jgi:PEP-CTERM motif
MVLSRRSLALTLFATLGAFSTTTAYAQFNFTNIADNISTVDAEGNALIAATNPSVSNGKVAFLGFQPGVASGIYTGSGGTVTKVATLGDTTPVGTITAFPSGPVIQNDVVAFKAFAGGNYTILTSGNNGAGLTALPFSGGDPNSPSFSGSTVAYLSADNTSVRTNTGGTTTIAAQHGDVASIGTISSFQFRTISNSEGTVAFVAGSNNLTNQGVFRGNGGALTTIATRGQSVGTFGALDSFGGTAISGSNVAFYGIGSSPTTWGIFMGNGSSLTNLVKRGDAAPTGTFSAFGEYPSISGNTAAFRGDFGNSQTGIFLSSGAALTTVIQRGDTLFGGTVLNLNIEGHGYDGTNIAFTYQLTNGRAGVAMASLAIASAPEPGTLALLALGGTLALARRRRACR